MKNLLNVLKDFGKPKKSIHNFRTFSEALDHYGTDDKTLQKSYRNFCYMAYLWGICFIWGIVYFVLNLLVNSSFEAAAIFFSCISFGNWFKGASYAYSLKYQTLNVKPVLYSPKDYFPDFTYKIKMIYRDNTAIIKYK